ncbi:MAG TPA: DUF1801 domain-containing protein [Longimicrobiaceae bacterium]|nr:DUF1801 domain-containing protein [Longimicrobiaceae bacterium]
MQLTDLHLDAIDGHVERVAETVAGLRPHVLVFTGDSVDRLDTHAGVAPSTSTPERPMARSSAATVEEYLAELPEPRRAVVSAVRDVVVRNLPEGYRETMSWGMICWELPLERYPDTYNGQPLAYAALAAQKSHFALYLNCVYQQPGGDAALAEEFRRAGKRLDMGKSCVRFRRLDDLPLEVVGRVVAATPPDEFVAQYEASRGK